MESLLGPFHLLDPRVPLYLLAALLTVGLGVGVLLFERFALPGRRFFVLTLVLAAWLVPLGLTLAAPGPAEARLWLRVAYLFIPFTLPAVYWMGRSMATGAVGRLGWALVGLAMLFSLWNAASRTLVDGLQTIFVAGSVAWPAPVGLAYLTFEVVAVAATLQLLRRTRRGALSGAEQKEVVLLMAAAALGALCMADYLLALSPFRAGWVTPVVIPAAAALVTLAAVRYRMFAPGQSFATDEVLRAMSDAVLVSDVFGRIRGSNPAAHRLLERTDTQLLGMAAGRVVGTWDQGVWRPWEPAGKSRTLEQELRPLHGEVVQVRVSEEPIRFGGRHVGTVLVARDERDRLEAERALRASERRYRSLFWNNPGAVYEFDLKGRFVAANPAAEELLGRPVTELLGRPFAEIIADEDMAVAEEVFTTATGGRAREYEISVAHARGGERRIRGVTMPILGDTGQVTGVSGVALDVSEATEVKRELEVQRRYFADLFESSPEGIVLVEAESDRVIRVNDEFTRMFGYTAAEVVGRRLTDLIVPEDLAEEGRSLNGAAREGGRVRTETRRRRKDGTLVDVSVLARELAVPGEEGQLYGVYRDISDRIQTERELGRREEELRHAQKLEAVGRLAGGIAHDFNNLLTVINGHARFALDQLESKSPLEGDLHEIEKAGARAAALTQQLLAYSRRQVLHPRVLDPNTVVAEVHDMMRRLIGEHIRVETDLTDAPVRVRADQGQLEQVLVNLVMNARDAMPEGGTLRLATSELRLEPGDDRLERWEVGAGEYVRLQVADTGTGMDPRTLEHAFDPFFTTKEQGKGTGLGLATVIGIVKQSGGHVTLRSEPGKGTTCDVILPRADEEPAEERSADGEGRECPAGTILVVEDEAAVRKLVARVLKKHGCNVIAAEDGVQALALLEDCLDSVDLIITDLVMPDMGGRKLAERVRERRPDLPILFMSGYDDELVADSGASSDFLAKPFTPAQLAERVQRALAGGQPAAASPAH